MKNFVAQSDHTMLSSHLERYLKTDVIKVTYERAIRREAFTKLFE